MSALPKQDSAGRRRLRGDLQEYLHEFFYVQSLIIEVYGVNFKKFSIAVLLMLFSVFTKTLLTFMTTES